MPATPRVLSVRPCDREAVFVLAGDPSGADIAAPRAGTGMWHSGTGHADTLELLHLPPNAGDAVELVLPEDLTGLGLSHYLTEGLGLSEAEIAPDWSLLNGLQGPVILLHGRLAGRSGCQISLPDGLTLIGRHTPDTQPLDMSPLPAQTSASPRHAARPVSGRRAPDNHPWLATLLTGAGLLLVLLALGLLLL